MIVTMQIDMGNIKHGIIKSKRLSSKHTFKSVINGTVKKSLKSKDLSKIII